MIDGMHPSHQCEWLVSFVGLFVMFLFIALFLPDSPANVSELRSKFGTGTKFQAE